MQQALIPWAPSFIFMERAGPLHIFDLHLSDERKRAWNTTPQLFSSGLLFFPRFVLWGHPERNVGCMSELPEAFEFLEARNNTNVKGGGEGGGKFLPSLVSGWWSTELTAASKSYENTFFRLYMGFGALLLVLNSLFRNLGHKMLLCFKGEVSSHQWLAFPVLCT